MTTPRSESPPSGRSHLQKIGLGSVTVAAVAGVGWLGWHVYEVEQRGTRAAEAGALYDDATVREIAPALLQWQETAALNPGLKSVHGFALLADGRMAVAGERLVRILGAHGQKVLDIELGAVPQTVGAGADGMLFVALKDHIEVYKATGEKMAAWPALGPKAFITCVSVHGPDVWLADAGRRLIVHTDLTGQVLQEMGAQDEAKHVPGLIVPSPHFDVAVGPDGAVWASNPGRHSLEHYNDQGEVVGSWGVFGNRVQAFPGCCNPTDFAIFPDGRFVTAEKGVPRIKVYTKEGQLESVVAGPDAFHPDTAGMDVAVDGAGRVLALDPVKHTIRVFVPKAAAMAETK